MPGTMSLRGIAVLKPLPAARLLPLCKADGVPELKNSESLVMDRLSVRRCGESAV